jgi:hypothetical protein
MISRHRGEIASGLARQIGQVALTDFPRADIYPALIFKPNLADVNKAARGGSFRGRTMEAVHREPRDTEPAGSNSFRS